MKFPQIGETLPNGHTVFAAYAIGEDRYVLAHKDGAPQPYAVWDVDMDGDSRNGRYFGEMKKAQTCLAALINDAADSTEAIKSQEKFKYEYCVKSTMLTVYIAILRHFKGAARKGMVWFLNNVEIEELYPSKELARGHFEARACLNQLMKRGQL